MSGRANKGERHAPKRRAAEVEAGALGGGAEWRRVSCRPSGPPGRFIRRVPQGGDRSQGEPWRRQHCKAADRSEGEGPAQEDLDERGLDRWDENREAGDGWVEGGRQPRFGGVGLGTKLADHQHVRLGARRKLHLQREP